MNADLLPAVGRGGVAANETGRFAAVPAERDGGRRHASRKRRICCRLPAAGGRGRWVIAGPILGEDDVDPFRFSVAIMVEGLPSFSCREVYARSVPMLVDKGVYSSIAAAFPSMRRVATESGDAAACSQNEPSWSSGDTEDIPIRRVLDAAAAAMKRSGKHVAKGYVKFVAFLPLSTHPWYAHNVHLRRRRDERRGAMAYKDALSCMTGDDERRLLRAANSTALLAVRHSTTYRVRSPLEKAQGLRAIKKRPWRGVGAPTVIPARKRLVDLKRRVFERCARVGHAMITMREDGEAEVWTYIRGSGLLGVRLYEASDGTVKRLACHSHKQRRERNGAGATCGNASGRRDPFGDDTLGGLGTAPDAVGVVPGVSASETSHGRASRRDCTASVTPVDVFAHDSPLGDWGGPVPAEQLDGRLTSEELKILKCSKLEDLDGTRPLVIVAVQFDIVAAISAAIARRTKRCTAADVGGGGVAWSMGSDGGPVRHSSITLFTLTLSAPWLLKGRTAMLPIMYILAGEHSLHSALGDRLDALLTEAVCASYDIPVHAAADDEDNGDVNSPKTEPRPDQDAMPQQSFYSWTGPRLVRIVGDFSMLAHIMGLTGGSDDSRCPFWWPCMPRTFLSIGAHAAARGKRRTVEDICKQWELVCWGLARWCMLRSPSVALDKGSVSVVCGECGSMTPLSSPRAADFQCRVPACCGTTSAFARILPTPLKSVFNLLRRRAGGVRGYPVLRTTPVLLQVPVLHCTGSIMKKITYLFLSELGEARRAVVKKGMYEVTGRANLGDLYLREHIKLVALILACEDIVGVPVDPAVMTMWSLALMLSAAWRQALAGPMEHRDKYLHVLELTAGLLAPVWAAIKPLDKDKKGSGVESLYLHAALVHARDSMGANSPAEAVITDDHVEGTIRDMGRHCGTRVNNMSRAQAVTEFHALADDDAATLTRNCFAAELAWYTNRIAVCHCCQTNVGAARAADITEAIRRADAGDVVNVSPEDEEEGTPTSLSIPACLVFDPDERAAPVSAWEGKETRVARVLRERLRVVTVCICGAGWDRPSGTLGERLTALRRQGPNSSPVSAGPPGGDTDRDGQPQPCEDPVVHPAQRLVSCRQAATAAVDPPRDPVLVEREDARVWMERHTAGCRARRRECNGECVEEEEDDLDPFVEPIWSTNHLDEDVVGDGDHSNFGHARRDEVVLDPAPDAVLRDGGDNLDDEEDQGVQGAPKADDTAAPDHVPFLASCVAGDPHLQAYTPPTDLLNAVLDESADKFMGDVVDAASRHHRLAEEDMLLRIFLLRLHEPPFANWANTCNLRLSDVRGAIENVLQKLQRVRTSLPGANIVTL